MTPGLLWLLTLLYLIIRKYVPQETGRRFSALIGVLTFWMLLVNFLGVRWWQALHPGVLHAAERETVVSLPFEAPLLISVLSFFALFMYLFQHRVALEEMEDDLEDVRRAFVDQEQRMRNFRVENQDFIIEGYTFKEYKKNE